MLGERAKLSIVVLVFFILGLPFAIGAALRQGFGRHAGWLYLVRGIQFLPLHFTEVQRLHFNSLE